MGLRSFAAKVFGITHQDVRAVTPRGTFQRGWQGNTPNTPAGDHVGIYWTRAGNGSDAFYLLQGTNNGRPVKQFVNLSYLKKMASGQELTDCVYGGKNEPSLRGKLPSGGAFTIVGAAKAAYLSGQDGPRPYTGKIQGMAPVLDDSPFEEIAA